MPSKSPRSNSAKRVRHMEDRGGIGSGSARTTFCRCQSLLSKIERQPPKTTRSDGLRPGRAGSQRIPNPGDKRRIRLCEFLWRHFAPLAARLIRRTGFASPVLADVFAFDVAEVARDLLKPIQLERIGGGSGKECPADPRPILRVRLMHRREREEDAQHHGNAVDPNSITSSVQVGANSCGLIAFPDS